MFNLNRTVIIYVDRTNNLSQNVNGVKTFLSVPIYSTTATSDFQLINKKYAVDNFVDRTNNLNQDINGIKTFLSVPVLCYKCKY